jgi:hypothetical protein
MESSPRLSGALVDTSAPGGPGGHAAVYTRQRQVASAEPGQRADVGRKDTYAHGREYHGKILPWGLLVLCSLCVGGLPVHYHVTLPTGLVSTRVHGSKRDSGAQDPQTSGQHVRCTVFTYVPVTRDAFHPVGS